MNLQAFRESREAISEAHMMSQCSALKVASGKGN
jgi:hypothetical protein